jgi:hypothetical protein
MYLFRLSYWYFFHGCPELLAAAAFWLSQPVSSTLGGKGPSPGLIVAFSAGGRTVYCFSSLRSCFAGYRAWRALAHRHTPTTLIARQAASGPRSSARHPFRAEPRCFHHDETSLNPPERLPIAGRLHVSNHAFVDLFRSASPEVTPVLHFVNATVYDALHERAPSDQKQRGRESSVTALWLVSFDISYNRTGRRQSLAKVFNLGKF